MDFWRTKQYKKRKRNKELRRLGLLPPIAKAIKLPGTERQRNVARHKLQIKQTGSNSWEVWGGNNTHQLRMEEGEIKCDCTYNVIDHKICVHILKVCMEKGILT